VIRPASRHSTISGTPTPPNSPTWSHRSPNTSASSTPSPAARAPFLFLSALTDDCLLRGQPLLSGGVRHLAATLETYGNTNAADALHAIDQLVFRERKLTLPQIVAACDADFEGPPHAAVRRALLAVPKYGNDDGGADAMACRVHQHICGLTAEQAARVGLQAHLVVIINNWANVVLGSHTGRRQTGARRARPSPTATIPRRAPTAMG